MNAATGLSLAHAASEPALWQIDRFLVPAGARDAAAFVAGHLYVAHGLRDRLLWPCHRRVRARTLLRRAATSDLTAASRAAVEAAASIARVQPSSGWIVEADYLGSARQRSVLFVFDQAARVPTFVVKRVPALGRAARSLSEERATLEILSHVLPADLRASVPSVVAHEVAHGWESLSLTWLPGRSAYVDLHTRLVPWRVAEAHFEAAVTWLARFHEATTAAGRIVQPPDVPGSVESDEPTPGWYQAFRDACGRAPLLAVRTHGDFWARNALLSSRPGPTHVSGVVDWEHSHEAGSPFDDLFHFALTYGANYPWARYRRVDARDAFRRTFLESNAVSRAVRSGFQTYCRERGLDARLLAGWFRCFLRERASRDESKGAPWMDFDRMIGAADRSVFSG